MSCMFLSLLIESKVLMWPRLYILFDDALRVTLA